MKYETKGRMEWEDRIETICMWEREGEGKWELKKLKAWKFRKRKWENIKKIGTLENIKLKNIKKIGSMENGKNMNLENIGKIWSMEVWKIRNEKISRKLDIWEV